MGGGGLPNSQNFCKFTKYFFVCQIHSEVLKHVLQMGGNDILSISTFNHHSRIFKVAAVILLQKKLGIIWIRGSQKGVCGGGSDVWEKFPNNIFFFVWQRTLVVLLPSLTQKPLWEKIPNHHQFWSRVLSQGKELDHSLGGTWPGP